MLVKTACSSIGVLLLLSGIAGFFDRGMIGMHLSTTHNIIHIISGLLAIFFGMSDKEASARMFCRIFGLAYGLLGIVGLFFGPGITTLNHLSGLYDAHLFKLVPGYLELGTADHAVHIVLGALLLITGFMPEEVEHRIEEKAHKARERTRV